MKFKRSAFLFLLIFPSMVFSQTITYTEPEKDDSRSLEFEIIGKVSGNYLIFKSNRNHFNLSVYDNEMDLKDRVNLDFIPEKTLNTDFIAYPDFAYIIYQYQKRGTLYCMLSKIDGNGKKMGEAIELDTTHIGVFADNKIYNAIYSEDKQKIMIYKLQKKNEKFFFTTLLFDAQLKLLRKSRMEMPYSEYKDIYSDFFVDNEGNLVFAKSVKDGSRQLASTLFLITKPAMTDKFEINELNISKHYVDEVKIKIDNINRRYLINTFYYKEKHGNVEGLYTIIWDKQNSKPFISNMIPFATALREEAKAKGNIKYAFDDYFIRHIIVKKDGGFILAAEDFTSQSRGNARNRYDYLYGSPYLSSYDYYLFSNSYYGNPYRGRGYGSFNQQTRYFYNNIAVMNIDKDGGLIWSKVIHKDQFDDDNDNMLSYQVMNSGGELHFLFNERERRNNLIADQSISPDGKITRYPTLKSLDKGYEFMPKFAKQVSATQIIIPCNYRNYICFAKIDY